MNAAEAVEEGLGQPLAPSTLLQAMSVQDLRLSFETAGRHTVHHQMAQHVLACHSHIQHVGAGTSMVHHQLAVQPKSLTPTSQQTAAVHEPAKACEQQTAAKCKQIHGLASLGHCHPLAVLVYLKRVLCREQLEGWGASEGLAQLWDEHLSAVVQHRIQTLQHTLAGQVELIQQHPVPSLDS